MRGFECLLGIERPLLPGRLCLGAAGRSVVQPLVIDPVFVSHGSATQWSMISRS